MKGNLFQNMQNLLRILDLQIVNVKVIYIKFNMYEL